MEAIQNLKDFGFKLDANHIRKIAFSRKCIVNQCFVELIDLSYNSSSAVLDSRFSSNLRQVISSCSSQTAPTDSIRILVCLLVPPDAPCVKICSWLASLQQL